MKVKVIGTGPLAEATRGFCSICFPSDESPDILWYCSDEPIPHENTNALILISWPVTPGTIKKLEQKYPEHTFAYSPENVRLAHAKSDFVSQERVICGVRKPDPRLDTLFAPITNNLHYVSIETAEMVKHALNGFLALSVAYANELGELCKQTGADMRHVTFALRSDPRIGMKAYLDAGNPYGSHLEREINNLLTIRETTLISAIKRSNDEHKSR